VQPGTFEDKEWEKDRVEAFQGIINRVDLNNLWVKKSLRDDYERETNSDREY